MKRNMTAVLTTLTGMPIKDGEASLTLGAVATNALLMPYEDERNLSGDDKVKRFKLAQRIHDAQGEVDISSEEITLLKSLIAKAYTPLVVGRAFAILEAEAEVVAAQ